MIKKIFTKKPLDDLLTTRNNDNGLKRSIGPVGLILLGLVV